MKRRIHNKIITPLFAQNTPVTVTKKVKYLGIWFDSYMSFKPHISAAIERAFAAKQKLYPSYP